MMKKIEKLIGKIGITLLILCCFYVTGVSSAENQKVINNLENGNVIKGKELYFKGREMFYNAESKLDSAMVVLASSKEAFATLPESDLKNYWLSQVEFTLAEINEIMGNKKEAALGFTKSGDLAKKALDCNDKFSDAYRLLADTYMRLMEYNGPLYTASHGMQALKLAEKAVRLDHQNFTALNSLGVYYINAPKIGGGDPDKGIATLKKALESKNPFDQFISNVWLGRAYLKKNNKTEALKYLNQALTIYPNSPWAKRIMNQCVQM